MNELSKPLTPDHLATIDRELQVMQDLGGLLSRSAAAGIDVARLEEERQRNIQKLTALKREFFGYTGS